MKKFSFSLVLFSIALGLSVSSCKKDSLSEEDAMRLNNTLNQNNVAFSDSLEKVKVEYSVTLLDASTTSLKSVLANSPFTGASVSLSLGGTIINAKVDSISGIATFKNVRAGIADVTIKMTGYSDVYYTVDLGSAGNTRASNIIGMLPSTVTTFSTLSGIVTYERDLTNNTPEAASGVQVSALIDITNSEFLNKVVASGATIKSISYGDLNLVATTDAAGNYSMRVPVTSNGLKYTIKVADFIVNQKILLDSLRNVLVYRVDSVPTVFGFLGGAVPTAIPGITKAPVAVVNIDAPGYTGTGATGSVVLDNKVGIKDITVSANGSYYEKPVIASAISLPINNGVVSDVPTTHANAATAEFYVNSGRITHVSITGEGTDYTYAGFDGKEITLPYVINNNVVGVDVTAINGSGGITAAAPTNGGTYTTKNVSLSLSAGTGSGAILTPVFAENGNGTWSVTSITVTQAGTSYTTASKFTGSVPADVNKMKAILHLTKASVTAVNISNPGAFYKGGKTKVVITGDGVGATAYPVIAKDSTGRIIQVIVATAGSGYTTAGVQFINTQQTAQAKAIVWKAGVSTLGAINTITLLDGGDGYYTVPSVTVSSAISGIGNGASLRAVIASGKVTGFAIDAPGTGYFAQNTFLKGISAKINDGAIATSVEVKGNTTTVANIYLGTGTRIVK